MKNNLLITTGFIGLLSVASQAAVIVNEDFVAIDDWVFDVNSDGIGGNLTSVATGGNTAILEAVNADGGENEGTLTRTFSTIGFTDINIDFSAFQRQGGSFEGAESFNLEVSTDGGATFSSLSDGPINARLRDGGGSTGTANATLDTFTLTGESLAAAADDGSFDLRITINTGFRAANFAQTSNEVFILENLVVNGTAITVPEPSVFGLLGLGAFSMFLRRRK